jgi:uncharacterized protein YbaR (Trm112 family)
MIDALLLSVLACPACQSDVAEKDGRIVCLNADCGLRYPVRDGVPVMLVSEAETVAGEMKGRP